MSGPRTFHPRASVSPARNAARSSPPRGPARSATLPPGSCSPRHSSDPKAGRLRNGSPAPEAPGGRRRRSRSFRNGFREPRNEKSRTNKVAGVTCFQENGYICFKRITSRPCPGLPADDAFVFSGYAVYLPRTNRPATTHRPAAGDTFVFQRILLYLSQTNRRATAHRPLADKCFRFSSNIRIFVTF